jgi:chemotaxis protein histidine kinase CheA
MIELRISDDGKGIDYEAVRRKAIGTGMVKHDAALDQSQAVEVIFASGSPRRRR